MTSGPPKPRGRLPLVGHALPALRDLLGSFDRWAEEVGDIYRLDIPFRNTCIVNRPDEIERVLGHGQEFGRSVELRRSKDLFGEGLIVSEGDLWKRQRRMMQPAFHRERINGYGQRMVELTEQAASAWSPGEVRDMHKAAMALTLTIATSVLFGADEVPTDDVARAMDAFLQRFDGVSALLPAWLPLRRFVEYRKGIARLDRVVFEMVARRRQQAAERFDLLSILLHAQDEGGAGMTDKQLRDEMISLLGAGHETVANALTWTWHLLAGHPDVERKLLDEADALGGPPTHEDVPRLPYTAAVLDESMRLYPPVWFLSRELIGEWEIDGFRLERGTHVSMCPWVVHRDRRFFADPLRFRPERWLDGSTESLPSYAYFPFGGGQHLCIGRPFALLEGTLLLATIARRWRLRSVPEAKVVPLASFTLRPRHGLPMRLERR